jgi:cytochrome c oxidase subunit 4
MTHSVHPVRMYVTIFAILLVMTFTTVLVAEVELGPWNVVVALAIAIFKAILVVLFFMDVRRSSGLTKLFVIAGLFWMVILFGMTSNDYLARGWTPLGKWW